MNRTPQETVPARAVHSSRPAVEKRPEPVEFGPHDLVVIDLDPSEWPEWTDRPALLYFKRAGDPSKKGGRHGRHQ